MNLTRFVPRCTVVGSSGTAVVPSSYPPFCGWRLSVSITLSHFVALVSTLVHHASLGDRGHVEVYCAWDHAVQREYCEARVGILLNLGLTARDFDVHDLLSICVPCEGSERISRRRVCISIFQLGHALRRVRATVHA